MNSGPNRILDKLKNPFSLCLEEEHGGAGGGVRVTNNKHFRLSVLTCVAKVTPILWFKPITQAGFHCSDSCKIQSGFGSNTSQGNFFVL